MHPLSFEYEERERGKSNGRSCEKKQFNEALSTVELQQQLLLIAINLEDDALTTKEAARRLMGVAHSLAEGSLEAYDQIISDE